jgi:hypothetical protein
MDDLAIEIARTEMFREVYSPELGSCGTTPQDRLNRPSPRSIMGADRALSDVPLPTP